MEVMQMLLRDEEGFSTVGMVLALLISLALIFSAAQVYQVNSASADIQNVADAAALSAENVVAEFYIVARVCDAVVLSMSLTALAALGVGVVALCIPPVSAFGETLIKTGNDMMEARNSFARKASEGLDRFQRLIPFLGAAKAVAVTDANSGGKLHASYAGFAMMLPSEGEPIEVGGSAAAQDLVEEIDERQGDIKRIAEEAEEAARKANAEKLAAFTHDCGNNPGYCMYERADHLAAMPATSNPLYHSVDAWSFSVALERAKAYYPYRLSQEAPTDPSVEGQADSALRKRFYAFAVQELAQGYVHETDVSFDAYFPKLPKNTDEMKATELYAEPVYPITQNDSGSQTMHAWGGCPQACAQESAGSGSIAQLDGGGFETCADCQFTVSSMGKVAAASSSIENGFEYHYRKVAEAAEAYQKARDEYDPLAEELKELTDGIFDTLKDAFAEIAGYRIEVSPPGRFGSVALVVNTQEAAASANFESSFVSYSGSLGMQAAVSAATLVSDNPEEGSTVISSLLDGMAGNQEFLGFGALDVLVDMWSSVLMAYTKGQEALEEGVEALLDGIPLVSESGLGAWAAKQLRELVDAVGLAPVPLDAPKPVTVNSAHVLQADEGGTASGLLEVKTRYLALAGSGSGSLFSTVVSEAEAAALAGLSDFDGTLTIASIELFGEGGPSVPLTIVLPDWVTSVTGGVIGGVADSLRGAEAQVIGVRRWE